MEWGIFSDSKQLKHSGIRQYTYLLSLSLQLSEECSLLGKSSPHMKGWGGGWMQEALGKNMDGLLTIYSFIAASVCFSWQVQDSSVWNVFKFP